MRIHLIFCFLLLALGAKAVETQVNMATFANSYSTAADGDVLLMETGIYASAITFPSGKTVTLKAAEGANVEINFSVNGNDVNIANGGLIFDGVTIKPSSDYFISVDAIGDVATITVKNSTITTVKRCFIRTNNAGYSISNIEFDNCIISDCGGNGWNFIYPKHLVKNVSVKNSTLYNYTNGESFFCANQAGTDNVLTFLFENNTVYKWAKSSDRALCKTENKYNAASTYTFRNNIVTVPGVSGTIPQMVQVSSGVITATNNLVVNYGGYTGGTQTINDLTLTDLGLTSIDFPDPDNGNFTILSTSTLAIAGVGGTCLGDPRWIKTLAQAVNLQTDVYPANAGNAVPPQAPFEAGEQATVTASYNFGYRFKEWQDETGKAISTENPYTFTINEDTKLTAVFEALTVYSLTINKEGEGAQWGNVSLSPEPVNGHYEAGTIVSLTVVPNPVTSFISWGDQKTELSRTISMDQNQTITATFDIIPFILGWDFNNPSSIRTNRPGDFSVRTDNAGVMKFFNGDGSSTSWGGSTKTFGGITYDCARRYTEYSNMSNPRYFQAEFSAKGQEQITYKNIRIVSFVAADNTCVHKVQKLQYSTAEAGPYTDLATVDLTSSYNAEWVELSATLPELTEDEKTKIFVRWVGDTESGLLGTPTTTDTEGFYLANIVVYADIDEEPDPIAPTLLSSVPAAGSNTASANGSIVLTFDKRIKAGLNGGKIDFNGETITPVIGNRTVSYAYKNLEYGKEYTFTIPSGVISNMYDVEYAGTSITFSIMDRLPPIARLFDAAVAQDGSGDYMTIQEAINAAPAGRVTPWLIFIKNGSYKELINVPTEKTFIHLIGQDKNKTIIHEKINVQGDPENDKDQSYYANSLAAWEYSKNNPSSIMYNKNDGTVVKISGNDFYAENISFVNDWGVDAQNGPQALAMMTYGDRVSFYNCIFRSFQDTWKTTNKDSFRGYAKDCFIEGAVDYIYGTGDYYFETCTLYCVRGGSVIVAPNHKEGTKWGYVFEQCIIDGNAASNDGRTKLGRPWHEFPLTAFLNTTMKIAIAPEGWTEMGGFPKVFAEYNSVDANGNFIDLTNRKTSYAGDDKPGVTLPCKAVLTDEEAIAYTYSAVTEGTDNWNPRSNFEAVTKPQNLVIDDNNKLSWSSVAYAICYVILRNDEVIGFTTETNFEDETGTSDDTYLVRAVNEYGSLGEAASPGSSVNINDEGITSLFRTYLTADNIVIDNVELNTIVRINSIDGRQVSQTKANNASVLISRAGLKGVYILTIGNKSIKIIL